VAWGPRVYDLACAVAGCAFAEDETDLTTARVVALLQGYTAGQPLAPAEARLLPACIRVCVALIVYRQ